MPQKRNLHQQQSGRHAWSGPSASMRGHAPSKLPHYYLLAGVGRPDFWKCGEYWKPRGFVIWGPKSGRSPYPATSLEWALSNCAGSEDPRTCMGTDLFGSWLWASSKALARFENPTSSFGVGVASSPWQSLIDFAPPQAEQAPRIHARLWSSNLSTPLKI